MSATSYPLGRESAAGAAAALGGGPGDELAGARRRLTLALLWLAGLIAWGPFSYVSDPPAGDRGRPSVGAEEQLDGRGKWLGYTSGWRSRSHVLQDAGSVGRD